MSPKARKNLIEKYIDLCSRQKELETEKEEMKGKVIEEMKKTGLKNAVTEQGTLTWQTRRTWKLNSEAQAEARVWKREFERKCVMEDRAELKETEVVAFFPPGAEAYEISE